jgi:hypothetical protein
MRKFYSLNPAYLLTNWTNEPTGPLHIVNTWTNGTVTHQKLFIFKKPSEFAGYDHISEPHH